MISILELPEVRSRVSPISVESYHQMGEFSERGRRTELIRGIVIEKLSKPPLHSAIAKRLYDLITTLLPAGFVVRREDPLTLADSEPEPDIAVVQGDEEAFFTAHPATAELVVEVAVSSAALDRANASLYAEAGVKEYWIVLGPEREIEIHRQPEAGRYRQTARISEEDELSSTAVPEIRFPARRLFGGR